VPELPEVETVVRDLRPLLLDRMITTIEVGPKVLRRRWLAEWNDALLGRRVHEVKRRGKWIIIVLGPGDLHLVFHLGMTGQLKVVSSRDPRETHTHLVMNLDRGGRQLRFRDMRRFGSATLFAAGEEMEGFFTQSGLGPEPFGLDVKYFQSRVRRTNRSLKAVLLDQRVVAGVGNIYADEALHVARLHPARIGRETAPAQARRLCDAMEKVLTRAIEQRGSSIRDYVGGSGLKGQYQEEFMVYGRGGEPCRRCGTAIKRIRLAGRSTHFCPRCQKEE
jgi:formamidopyrimidine-DNA glycosylase